MTNVVQLPTAPRDYIRVRHRGKLWHVDLVTPCDMGPVIATTLVSSSNPDIAVDYARNTAESMKRQLRLPKSLRDAS